MPLSDAPGLLSLLWSPLVVVTAAAAGERGGQIAVSAFAASIVAEQPRLMLEVQKRNRTHALIEASGRFAINLLSRDRQPWVRHFGLLSQSEVDKFAPSEALGPDDWRAGPHGIPLLNDALGVLVCRTVNAMDGGDMTVYLAVVEAAERQSEAEPVGWQEMRAMMGPEWAEEYGRKLAHDVPDSARRMRTINFRPFQPPSSEA